jgi:hypothetical protein
MIKKNLIFLLFFTNLFVQDFLCDKIFLSEEVDVEAKMEPIKALQFFNNQSLPIFK